MDNLKNQFLLKEGMVYLNHGSFGACPKPVFDQYQSWQRQLESQPIQFLTDTIYSELKKSRQSLSELVGCHEHEIIFFDNPTTAVTNVIHNLDLNPGDEVLTTSYEYGALVRAWSEWCNKTGAKFVQRQLSLPLEDESSFVDTFWEGVTDKTKVIFISHITSSTGLVLPIDKIIQRAQASNITTIVDGAHVPAHISLNIQELGCDFYTGACHKWLCAPKGSSFLFVKEKFQINMKPVIYSWGKEGDDPGPSEFLQDFNWQGTRDMSAFITISKAIEYYKTSIEPNQNRCRELTQVAYNAFNSILKTDPLSSGGDFIGQMVSHPLPENTPKDLKQRLWNDYHIEIPVFEWNRTSHIRISIQVYNSENDIDLLISALESLI